MHRGERCMQTPRWPAASSRASRCRNGCQVVSTRPEAAVPPTALRRQKAPRPGAAAHDGAGRHAAHRRAAAGTSATAPGHRTPTASVTAAGSRAGQTSSHEVRCRTPACTPAAVRHPRPGDSSPATPSPPRPPRDGPRTVPDSDAAYAAPPRAAPRTAPRTGRATGAAHTPTPHRSAVAPAAKTTPRPRHDPRSCRPGRAAPHTSVRTRHTDAEPYRARPRQAPATYPTIRPTDS